MVRQRISNGVVDATTPQSMQQRALEYYCLSVSPKVQNALISRYSSCLGLPHD